MFLIDVASGCSNQQTFLMISRRGLRVSPWNLYQMKAETSRVTVIVNVYMFLCCTKKHERENCRQQTQICRREAWRGPIHGWLSVAFLAARTLSWLATWAQVSTLMAPTSMHFALTITQPPELAATKRERTAQHSDNNSPTWRLTGSTSITLTCLSPPPPPAASSEQPTVIIPLLILSDQPTTIVGRQDKAKIHRQPEAQRTPPADNICWPPAWGRELRPETAGGPSCRSQPCLCLPPRTSWYL